MDERFAGNLVCYVRPELYQPGGERAEKGDLLPVSVSGYVSSFSL